MRKSENENDSKQEQENERDSLSRGSTERLELARRLHDGPAQRLIALGYQLDALISESSIDSFHRRRLRELRIELSALSESFRDELYLLSRQDFDSLKSRIPLICSAMEVQVELPSDIGNIELENAISQICLEIARNSAKHSGAKRFWILFQESEASIKIEVGDDGLGTLSLRERSLGLKLISDQVSSFSGELSYVSNQSGTQFLIELPKL